MAIEISKAELLKSAVASESVEESVAETVAEAETFDLNSFSQLLEQINILLNNDLIKRLIAKYLNIDYEQQQQQIAISNSMSAEQIYEMLVSAMRNMLTVLGEDVKLKDVLDYMVENREKVIEVLNSYVQRN